MTLFGTSFSLVLCGLRLRVRIEFDDETGATPNAPAPHHYEALRPRTPDRTTSR